MTRLDQFLNVDDDARDRAARISSIGGAGGFLFAKVVLALQDEKLGYFTILTIACFYLWFVWRYCSAPSEYRQRHEPSPPVLIPRRVLMAIVSLATGIVLSVFPTSAVEAAIQNRRLLGVAEKAAISSDDARTIEDSLGVVKQLGLPLPTDTVIRVRDVVRASALEDPTSSSALDAIRALSKYSDYVGDRSATGAELAARKAYYRARSHDFSQSSEVNEAIEVITEALAIADGDKEMESRLLLMRAMLYDSIEKHDEALADAERAYRLGAFDLADIISIEGSALYEKGADLRRPEDLSRAVKLLSLSLHLDLPQWVSTPSQIVNFRAAILAERAEAFYFLGQFNNAIQDARASLSLGSSLPNDVAGTYLTLVRSELGLNRSNEALDAAREWVQKTADPRASIVNRIVEQNLSDPSRAMSLLPRRYLDIR